jgi:triosephosphate isomerase
MALIIANWKMNGRRQDVEDTARIWLSAPSLLRQEIVWALPSLYLPVAHAFVRDSSLNLCAQDVSLFAQDGAYTGEHSAAMLRDIGCGYALIGHSERRRYFGEDASVLCKKLEHSFNERLTPIYCIGETQEEKMAGRTLIALREQLDILKNLNVVNQSFVIGYEPVWAIGSGKTPEVQEIEETMGYLKEYLLQMLPSSDKVRLVYGGSVDAALASDLGGFCDGILVGSQSLAPERFIDICEKIK